MITVRIPALFADGGKALLTINEPVVTLRDLLDVVDRRLPHAAGAHSFSVNGAMIVNGERFVTLTDGDEVEILEV
jgi:hypothetical protein